MGGECGCSCWALLLLLLAAAPHLLLLLLLQRSPRLTTATTRSPPLHALRPPAAEELETDDGYRLPTAYDDDEKGRDKRYEVLTARYR